MILTSTPTLSGATTIKWEKLALVSQDMFCTFNMEGFYTYTSEVCNDLLGYSQDEILGQHFTDLVHPEDVTLAKEVLLVSSVTQGKRSFKNRLVHKNGKLVYIQWSFTWSEEDATYYGVARDITEQEVSQKRLTAILDSITDAFLSINREGRITYLNKEAQRLLPFNSTRHLGDIIWDLFPAEVVQIAMPQCQLAFETGQTVTFTFQLTGYDKWYSVKAYPSEECLSIYFDDVTAKLKAKSEAEKLALVASKTNNGVLIVGKDGLIEWVNEGFTRLHGYTADEAIGCKPSVLLHHPCTDSSVYSPIEERLYKGESVHFEVLNRKKNGEWLYVSVEISPVADEYGEQRYVVIQTDITALKTSEFELTKLTQDLYRQKSDLQQFSYMVSHNLRSPVSNIQGLADLLLSSERNSMIYGKSLEYLKKSVSNLDTILMDMNVILGIRDTKKNLELNPVELSPALEQSLTSFKVSLNDIGANVSIDIPDGLSVKGNKAYLHSIFYNLLSNSIKYRADNRVLEINVSALRYTDNKVAISFSDNGSGFDISKAKNHVFKLYKRFHRGQNGRGMGLFLIKSHIETLGGHIEVTSTVGSGTRFMMYLPEL